MTAIRDRCECHDVDMHVFYATGGGFRWQWPRLTLLHPAKGGTYAALNRYPHNVIGAYVVLFGRGVGVMWKGTR